MLMRILSYYQVMPSYLELLMLFGVHKHTREKRFSSFRGHLQLAGRNSLPIDCLRRSGRQYQICYNLKAVGKWAEPNTLIPNNKNWSVRQGAFHHQFDVEKGTTLWIVTRAGQELKERIQDMTGSNGRSEDRQFQSPEECFESSLAVHLLLCHWSCENWRTYVQWLEDTIETEVSSLALMRQSQADSQIDISSSLSSSRAWWSSTGVLILAPAKSARSWRTNKRSNNGAWRQYWCSCSFAKFLPEIVGERPVSPKIQLRVKHYCVRWATR